MYRFQALVCQADHEIGSSSIQPKSGSPFGPLVDLSLRFPTLTLTVIAVKHAKPSTKLILSILRLVGLQ